MSTPVITPVDEKPFDQAAFIKARNEGTAKPVDRVEAHKVETPAPTQAAEQPSIKVPRHIRRENNRLREEAAELRGKLAAYETLGVKPNGEPATPKGETDPEPKQADFATEGEFYRALGRWEGRQGAKEEIGKQAEQTKEQKESAELQAHVLEMDAKFNEDKKLIADWGEVGKAAQEDDALNYDTAKDALLIGLLAHSDVRAFMLHHFAKNPADFERMIGMREDANGLIAAFKRLEGKVETVYSKQQKQEEAAEASPKPKGQSQDRTRPENTEQARAPKVLPRPSTEVAARGGTAPPEAPTPGTKAWFDWRNAQTGGR